MWVNPLNGLLITRRNESLAINLTKIEEMS